MSIRARGFRTGEIPPRTGSSVEMLEPRRMLAVGTDAAGWTVVAPSGDSRVVYVSSSAGNDGNSGLSASAPVKTIAKGKSLLRSGYPDWLLLRRGDTFHESFGNWNRSGRSQQEPMLLSAYGQGDRPRLNTGTAAGLNTSTSAGGVNHLAIISLSFFPDAYNHYNGASDMAGLRLTAAGKGVLIEDVRVAGYKDNVVISGENSAYKATDVTIRRSQILDSHADRNTSGTYRSQGLYIGASAERVTVEENIIDHNGWRPGVSSDRFDQNHNIYAQTGATDVVVRDNIITRASFYGLKFNSGGEVTGNFFARNSESIYLERPTLAAGNVITEAVDTAGGAFPVSGWGVGINTQKTPSATIRRNLITTALSASAAGVAGIQLFNNGTPFSGVVEHNIVYNWRNALLVNTPGNGPDSVIIRDNQIHTYSDAAAGDQRSAAVQSALVYERNTYSAGTRTSTANRISSYQSLGQWVSRTEEAGASYGLPGFVDAGRTIGRYAQSIGLAGTFEAFIDAARGLEKSNWNAALTSAGVNPWFWQGFSTGGGPAVLVDELDQETAEAKLMLHFSQDVGTSLSLNDISIVNLASGQVFGASSLSYSGASSIARITFNGGALADGNYRVVLPAGSVADLAGRPMSGDYRLDFHVLGGDANRDGTVNLADFATLAARFNRQGTYSQGDFDYNGVANIGDFAVLAGRFNQSVPVA